MRRVWALADTHLGEAMGKTMDRFGERWIGHKERIAENCGRLIAEGDVLLLPGDLSWAMRRAEAEPDLAFLAALPGIKVAIKGNHDYWWPSGKGLDHPGLHAPPFTLGDLGVAGTRGWFDPAPGSEDEAGNRKILERERTRLVRSLDAIADRPLKIAMVHYPPHPFLNELAAAGVAAVAYGHLHLGGYPSDESLVHNGESVSGVPLFCVAGDRLDFSPRLLTEF